MSAAQCCSNRPTLDPSSGEGHVEKLGGLDSYVTASPNSKLGLLLFFSDIYGYEALNLRKLADKIAAAGFFVVVPDFFHGDPYTQGYLSRLEIWLKGHGTVRKSALSKDESEGSFWQFTAEIDKGVEEAKPVIQDLRSKGISAIGAAGFCWGEVKVPVAILGAELDNTSPPELVKQFEEALSTKPEIDYFVKIYQGAKHGWTTK